MRLKFLFFPIMLIISLSIGLGFIWPEVDKLTNQNKEKTVNTQALQTIRDKQAAIELVGAQIARDSAGEMMVKSYLPDKKVEERIIGNVNYLATDAGVSLVNILLKSPSQSGADVILANTPAVATTANLAGPAITAPAIKYSQAMISVSGEYSNIRIFMDKVQRIPLFNSIKSLTISNRSEASKTSDSGSSTAISADIVMDFGYIEPFKLNNQQISKFNAQLDNETMNALKQYISQSVQYSVSEDQAKGKTNPFLP